MKILTNFPTKILILLSSLTCFQSQAALIQLNATIDGQSADAGAGTGSRGTGVGDLTFDDVTSLFSWEISWTGLTNVTVAHFHGPAEPSENASIEVDISVDDNPSMGSATLNDVQSADLLAGLWYINIHTEEFPAGEIRGQVLVIGSEEVVEDIGGGNGVDGDVSDVGDVNGLDPVPLPATFWLLACGFFSLLGFSKRRKS